MKFAGIYPEKKLEKKEEEFFITVTENRGIINITAVDKYGERLPCGSLLSIDKNGICLSGCVNKDLGFDLDECGQLRVR